MNFEEHIEDDRVKDEFLGSLTLSLIICVFYNSNDLNIATINGLWEANMFKKTQNEHLEAGASPQNKCVIKNYWMRQEFKWTWMSTRRMVYNHDQGGKIKFKYNMIVIVDFVLLL